MKIEIPEKLESLEGVPAQYQSLYVKAEDGAGYVYKDPKSAIEGMRRAKEERGEALEKVKDYESRFKDVDPEEYRTLKSKAKEFDDVEQIKKGELDKIKGELRDKYEGQISAAKQQIIDRDARYANRILSDHIDRALRKAGATDKGIELLASSLKGAVTTKMGDDGEPEFVILDKNKKQRLNDSADPFSIEDLVAEQRANLPVLFGGSGGSGSGAGQGDRQVSVPTDEKPSAWSAGQKKAFIEQYGHKAYQNLVVKEGQSNDSARRDAQRKRA